MRYLDANIFIYVLDKNSKQKYRKASEKILKRIESEETAVISFINVMEVLWWCEKYMKNKIKEVYDMILSYRNLKILNITSDMLEDAIFLKLKYGLELNDCISLVVMIKLKIKEIYSNDTGFDKAEWLKRVFK